MYYGFGYRKQVIRTNLKNSFPEKTEAEIIKIEKKFYHFFCDMTLETFKTLTISKEKMLKRCTLDPSAAKVLGQLATDNQSAIIVMGHQGNWEWAGNTFSLTCKQQLYVIYHPLTNPYFNGLICRMRERFGSKLIPMKDTFKEVIRNRNELTATAFIADQSPNPVKAHWMNFLNQDTSVFTGTEKIALKMKYPIVFVSVERLSRGFYTLKAELLQSPPYDEIEGQITETHTRRLEKEIIAHPETWLWSHNRWKHKR